jgi:fucose 4-O-acetylase-like acetyltransferase
VTIPRLAETAPAAPVVQTAPAGDQPGQRPPKQRDAYFDNAKFVTAILVVLGHVWAEFNGSSGAVNAAYKLVYAFHMPVFVFITGYFSRGFMRSPEKFRTLVPTLVVPYLIFIVLYRGQVVLLLGKDFDITEFFIPHFLMWFLVAMVFWRLSAPLWAHLRHPVAISVVVSLAAGLWIWSEDGTLSRMSGLLPFFVLGLMIEPDRLRELRRPPARLLGAAVLVLALPALYLWDRGPIELPEINMHLLWWDSGYQDMGYPALIGMGGRAATMLLAAILGAAFLAVIPRNRTWFTEMGTRTMYVYLLHGLVVKTLDYTGVLASPVLHNPVGIVGVTLAAVALGVLLSTSIVQRATRWAVEPRARWLLKPRHQTTRSSPTPTRAAS